MKSWKDVLIKPSVTVCDAINVIDKGSLQIAIVVDDNEKLLGTITDGDVRRALLKGVQLTDSIDKIMNKSPITLPLDATPVLIHNTMCEKNIRQMLIVNDGYIRNVVKIDDMISKTAAQAKVFLMAGGLGTRLHPFTENCPKSLIEVGNIPIIETAIKNFRVQGFHDITISVNYKGEMIKEFCGDGSRFGVSISYIDEDKRLGTAGALSLISDIPQEPFIVMNADLLTQINFKHFLDFHNSNNSEATMAVREYSFKIPYGVVKTEGVVLKEIIEKPQQNYFVNAGIYILNPQIIHDVPKNEFFDMPQLFDKLLRNNKNVSVFPIREYWIDIGHIQDLDIANSDYNNIF